MAANTLSSSVPSRFAHPERSAKLSWWSTIFEAGAPLDRFTPYSLFTLSAESITGGEHGVVGAGDRRDRGARAGAPPRTRPDRRVRRGGPHHRRGRRRLPRPRDHR